MDKSISKVTFIEAVCLILIITINRIILNLPQLIMDTCGSSAILNVVYVSVIAIIFTGLIILLFKNFTGYDIVDASEFLGGKIFKNIIAIILFLYLVSISGILLRNFSEVLHILYYSKAPILYILLFFITVAIISNIAGERSIIKTNVIVTIILLLSLLIAFIATTPSMEIQRIFPILGYGAKQTFFNGLSSIFSFNGLVCIYFIMPMLSEKKDYKKISLISVILVAILLFISVGSLLLSIPFNPNMKEISPMLTIISKNNFGNFIQHPESLFMFTWILSIMTYINVIAMFAVRFSNKIFKVKNSNVFVLPVCIIILVIALIPTNILEAYSVERMLYSYLAFPLTFVAFPIIMIMANIKYEHSHPKSDKGIKNN